MERHDGVVERVVNRQGTMALEYFSAVSDTGEAIVCLELQAIKALHVTGENIAVENNVLVRFGGASAGYTSYKYRIKMCR